MPWQACRDTAKLSEDPIPFALMQFESPRLLVDQTGSSRAHKVKTSPGHGVSSVP